MVILHSMKRPIFVRPLSDAERETLQAGLRSPDAFTLRRCQILLASNRGKNAYQIAQELGSNPQRPRVTPSTPSTRRVSRKRFGQARSVRIPFTGLSIPSKARLCASCFTRTPASSAKIRACGRWRLPLRSASRKGSPKSGSPVRPSGRRFRGWGCDGSGPNAGSLPQIPTT